MTFLLKVSKILKRLAAGERKKKDRRKEIHIFFSIALADDKGFGDETWTCTDHETKQPALSHKEKGRFCRKKREKKKRKVEEITPISFSQPPCFFHALNSTSKHRGAESHPLVRGWEAFSFFVGNTAMLRRAPERSETQMLISGNLVKKKKKKKKKKSVVWCVGGYL